MSLSRKFKTNLTCETKGIDLDYGDGTVIRVARAGGSNKQFMKTAQRLFKPHRRQLQLGILSNEKQEELAHLLYAQAVVLGWEGVTAEDIGEEGTELVPFNVENCVKLFVNLPDLFSDLQTQAQNSELFLDTIRETDAKN